MQNPLTLQVIKWSLQSSKEEMVAFPEELPLTFRGITPERVDKINQSCVDLDEISRSIIIFCSQI